MKKIISFFDDLFFRDVSASGFGLLRIAWAATALFFFLGMQSQIVRYFSGGGIMPSELGYLTFRSEYRYTLLNTFTTPEAVIGLYWLLITTLTCMMLGIWPRIMTILSVLLVFSFHERNLQPLGGGDTVIRNIGFILMLAPELRAFSLSRMEQQWKHWKGTSTLLPPLKAPIWGYRLLLWQLMIIYVSSAWDKTMGSMWMDGTIGEAVFHHTHFFRYGKTIQDLLVPLSPLVTLYTLAFEFLWILLLIPRAAWKSFPVWFQKHSLKRWLILGGLVFHGSILLLMNVGSFSLIMMATYLGLLLDDDFVAIKNIFNHKQKGKISVLYDGVCSLCQRSMFGLLLLDSLGRLRPVDFRDTKLKKKYAPEISEDDLDRAMHIIVPKEDKEIIYRGFDAFRKITWHLPVLMITTPFLWIPGVAPVGRRIYAGIAERRNRCAGGACKHR